MRKISRKGRVRRGAQALCLRHYNRLCKSKVLLDQERISHEKEQPKPCAKYARGGVSLAVVTAGLTLALNPALAPATLGDNSAAAGLNAIEALAAQTADGLAMRGMDTTAISGDAFDVATVVGLGSKTLYADVYVNGSKKAADIEYSYSNPDDQAGVVQLKTTLDVVAQHSGNVTVKFFSAKSADRGGADPVYEANLYAVCMRVNGEKTTQVVGLRTSSAADATRAFAAPRLVVRDGQTYRLTSTATSAATTLEDGTLYVDYAPASATGVAASVTYVDQDGAVLAVDSVGTLADGESQTVAVRKTVEGSSKVYVPLSKAATVTVTSANPEATITCVARKDADRTTSKVSVAYVTAEGKQLMADTVEVSSGGYNYAAPTTFSQSRDGAVARYELTGATDNRGNTYTAAQAAALSFTFDGATEYTLTYAAQNVQLGFTVNFALVAPDANGNLTVSVDPSLAKTAEFSKDAAATVELPETIERDGYTYTLFGGEKTLSFTWADFEAGALATDTAYYTRSDVTVPAAYDVCVRYVDAETGTQLSTQTLTCSPDGGALAIQGPETLTANGTSYVRLSGQETAITHRFFSPYRTYTIYYGVAGSKFAGDTTITRTTVIDGGTTTYSITTDGGSTSTSTNGGLVNDAAYTTVVTVVEEEPAETDANADAGANSRGGSQSESDVISPEGETLTEERLEDSENPLARAFAKGGIGWVVSAVAGVMAALLLLLFLILKRRRKQEEEEA